MIFNPVFGLGGPGVFGAAEEVGARTPELVVDHGIFARDPSHAEYMKPCRVSSQKRRPYFFVIRK